MSHSLFGRLQRRFGRPVDALTRRQFVKHSLLLGTAFLPSSATHAKRDSNKRVVVVGAGFAGLACAYELGNLGYDVTVVEARTRLGGRVRSFNATLGGEFVPGKNVEGGGELIGSNHPLWVSYADRFGLSFLDVSDDALHAPIVLQGRSLSAAECQRLWEEMDLTLAAMNREAEPIDADAPWNSPQAVRLDCRSLQSWIDEQRQASPLCRLAIATQEMANNGVDTRCQSFLGNLAAVKGGGLDKYWTESEVFRCAGGNQQLAEHFAKHIGRQRVLLGWPVQSCEKHGSEMLLTCADGRQLVCEDVVLSVPPSTWQQVRFSPPLPAILRPQMGVNLKFLAHVKSRYWQQLQRAQYSLADGPLSMTWEGTDNQPGNAEAGLHGFSGGPAAEACLAFPPNERDQRYAELFETIFPGFREQRIKTRFMDWPRDPWTLAGYSFPACGQVTCLGPLMAAGMENLHLAGEHTCYKFVGYMEGGLTSGVQAARKIARRDGLAI